MATFVGIDIVVIISPLFVSYYFLIGSAASQLHF